MGKSRHHHWLGHHLFKILKPFSVGFISCCSEFLRAFRLVHIISGRSVDQGDDMLITVGAFNHEGQVDRISPNSFFLIAELRSKVGASDIALIDFETER